MVFLFALFACQSTVPNTAQQQFEDEVVPVLERSCSAATCHGVVSTAEAEGEVLDWHTLLWRIDDDRRLTDRAEAWRVTKQFINTDESAVYSTLLRKPLLVSAGGLPHYAIDVFQSVEDPDYQALLRWVSVESAGGENAEALTALERHFADDVQPVMASMGCMTGSCHGPGSAVPFHLDPGVNGTFSITQSRANHQATRRLAAMDVAPIHSRLVRKPLPLQSGGMMHRGGNRQLFTGVNDPRLLALTDWICAEQHAVGFDCAATDRWTGVVFLRGPLAPEGPFDVDGFNPGNQLLYVDVDAAGQPGTERVLTDGTTDVRDPAVHPDGHRVLFAMRSAAMGGHDLYEVDLDTLDIERLTHDAGPLASGGTRTWRDPTYGPDNTIWAVGTAAGVVTQSGQRLDTDLYQLDRSNGPVRRRSFTPHMDRKPTFYRIGAGANQIGWSTLHDTHASQSEGQIYRFDPSLATESNLHFGNTPTEDLVFDMRELPDGNFVTVLGHPNNLWGGRLAVVDRNFGPEIPPNAPWQTPSVPAFLPPVSRLDPIALWRDPAPLPTNRLMAASATGPIDHLDPDANPDFGLRLIQLRPAIDGTTWEIAENLPWLDQPGVSETDPEPVWRRSPLVTSQAAWDESATTAIFQHQGFDTTDALLGNPPPAGPKTPTDTVVAVRIIEHLPRTATDRFPVPADNTLWRIPGATSDSLGAHGPARILAEVPLESDGSFQVELPAPIAIRLQGIDHRGLAVGPLRSRWYDLHPGQRLTQGVPSQHYTALCGACHGALDGDANHAFPEADLLTTASLTRARFDRQNPRRPLRPVLAGDNTRVEIDFLRDVQPILEQACASCHQGTSPPADLSLTANATPWFTDAYESLLAPGTQSLNGMAWVDQPDASAWGSHLAELLLGQELGAPGELGDHPNPGLSDDEIGTLLRWMDLGATFVGRPAP